jgi:hypothetical protein
MLLASSENFSENGARPVQILGRHGRLIGWARSFSNFMRVTDNTIVGGRPQGRLTRIAGRDVSEPDGHTVGKTFSRKELLGCPGQPPPARSPESASNHLPPPPDRHQNLNPSGPLLHKSSYPQNWVRDTGLGQESSAPFQRLFAADSREEPAIPAAASWGLLPGCAWSPAHVRRRRIGQESVRARGYFQERYCRPGARNRSRLHRTVGNLPGGLFCREDIGRMTGRRARHDLRPVPRSQLCRLAPPRRHLRDPAPPGHRRPSRRSQ